LCKAENIITDRVLYPGRIQWCSACSVGGARGLMITKVLPHWIAEWRDHEQKYLADGLSKTAAWTEIGQGYGVSRETVRYHLHVRAAAARPGGFKEPGDHDPRITPDRQTSHNRKNTVRIRAARQIETLLRAAFEGHEALSLEELAQRVSQLESDVVYQPLVRTTLEALGLERCLRGYRLRDSTAR